MDDKILELARAIDRDKIVRARARPIEEKVLAGGRLFDAVRERMIWGIRTQFPDFNDEQVHAEFLRRLRISRRMESVHERAS